MSRPKLNPAHDRDAMTVSDAQLIATEIRYSLKHIRAGVIVLGLNKDSETAKRCIEDHCRNLEVTAQAMETWATSVAMRRDAKGPAPPADDRTPPDPYWQSTDYARKLAEAKGLSDADKARRDHAGG